MAKVSIIGAGSWGTALAFVLAKNGHEVTVWSISESEIKMLEDNNEHLTNLPGVKLPKGIQYTADMGTAVHGKDMMVLAVPSIYTRSMAHRMKEFAGDSPLIVTVAKGIEEDTLMIMTDVIEDEIPGARAAILSGPSHAEEVGRRIPTTCVVGAHEKATAEYIQGLFMNKVFRIYTSPDMLGIELGGSLKNVIALAAGMADGMGYGDNTKAAIITRGISEIARLALAMGAKRETLNGLSGIGDLIVTCASGHSRNRKAGMLIGQGKTYQEAMDEVKMVVEGVYAAKAAKILAEKYQISMPIVEQVNEVLFHGKSTKAAVEELMERDKKEEEEDMLWDDRPALRAPLQGGE